MKIYNGYKRLNENYTLLTDEYEYTMANTYLESKKHNQKAVFDVFFRKIPNGGGYVVMAGLDKVIEYIKNLHFSEREINYFRRKGYSEDFIKYVSEFKFRGDIYAIPDGTPVFPNEPILTVKANLNEAQVVETTILCMLNGATEHATGARRIVEATPKGVGVMEFGARRADGGGQTALGILLSGPGIGEVDEQAVDLLTGENLLKVGHVHVDVEDVGQLHALGLLHGDHHGLPAALHGDHQHIGVGGGGLGGELALAAADLHPEGGGVGLQASPVALQQGRLGDPQGGAALHTDVQILHFTHSHI